MVYVVHILRYKRLQGCRCITHRCVPSMQRVKCMLWGFNYRQVSDIRRNYSQNLIVSRPVLQMSLCNILKPEPWFNIKMLSYQYRKSHCRDKTILRPSYLHNGISYTGKTASLYWIGAQVLSREWGCKWSSAGRRCSNYIWVINNFNDYLGAPYIRNLTVYGHDSGYIIGSTLRSFISLRRQYVLAVPDICSNNIQLYK